MGQLRFDRPPPVVIEPAINSTRHATGILPPMYDGVNWHIAVVENRIGADGCPEMIIIDRYLMSPPCFRQSIMTSIRALRLVRLLRLN